VSAAAPEGRFAVALKVTMPAAPAVTGVDAVPFAPVVATQRLEPQTPKVAVPPLVEVMAKVTAIPGAGVTPSASTTFTVRGDDAISPARTLVPGAVTMAKRSGFEFAVNVAVRAAAPPTASLAVNET